DSIVAGQLRETRRAALGIPRLRCVIGSTMRCSHALVRGAGVGLRKRRTLIGLVEQMCYRGTEMDAGLTSQRTARGGLAARPWSDRSRYATPEARAHGRPNGSAGPAARPVRQCAGDLAQPVGRVDRRGVSLGAS